MRVWWSVYLLRATVRIEGFGNVRKNGGHSSSLQRLIGLRLDGKRHWSPRLPLHNTDASLRWLWSVSGWTCFFRHFLNTRSPVDFWLWKLKSARPYAQKTRRTLYARRGFLTSATLREVYVKYFSCLFCSWCLRRSCLVTVWNDWIWFRTVMFMATVYTTLSVHYTLHYFL